MATINKPRVVKDYDKLPLDVQGQIKLTYPQGFAGSLITYINAKGKVVSALPYETDDHYYLVRMTLEEANNIVENDDDFNDDGICVMILHCKSSKVMMMLMKISMTFRMTCQRKRKKMMRFN